MQIIGLGILVKSFIYFITLGFLMPLIFKRFRDIKEIVMLSITVSLAVALLKFIVRLSSYGGRTVNVGEIILSVLGGIVGFIIYENLFRKRH